MGESHAEYRACTVRSVLSVLALLVVLLGVGGCGDHDVQLQGEDTIKFSPYGYEALFTHGNLHEIEIVISQEEWDAHIQDMKDYAETERFGWGMTGTYRKRSSSTKALGGMPLSLKWDSGQRGTPHE